MKKYDIPRNQFLSKNGENIINLSRYFLTMNNGDRLNTMSELAKMFKSGVGTVQTALQQLVEIGAVEIESKGHKGSYIIDMRKSVLWKYSLYEVITGNMPLLYTKRLLGLASGFYTSFEDNDIPLSMSYVRGGLLRVNKLVENKIDFTICSRLTAERAIEKYENLEIFMSLGDHTYADGAGMIFSSSNNSEVKVGMNVGVDSYSYDHKMLINSAYKDFDVNFVTLSYNEILGKLKSNDIDSTVWTRDEIKEKSSDLDIFSVASPDFEDITEKCNEAVVLINKENIDKMNAIKDIFDATLIREIQKDVMEDLRMPKY